MHIANPKEFRPRVLIVEDEYFLADDLARMFQRGGSSVVGFAASATKAREIIDRSPDLDLAVLDIRLVDGTSFEVADLLRTRGICVVFYTATQPSELPERFRNCPVVEKPNGAEVVYLEAMRACAETGAD